MFPKALLRLAVVSLQWGFKPQLVSTTHGRIPSRLILSVHLIVDNYRNWSLSPIMVQLAYQLEACVALPNSLYES